MARMNWDSAARKRNLCKPSAGELYRALFAASSFSDGRNRKKYVTTMNRRPVGTSPKYLPPSGFVTDTVRHRATIQPLLEAAQDAARLHDQDNALRYARAAHQSMINAGIDHSDLRWEMISRMINAFRP